MFNGVCAIALRSINIFHNTSIDIVHSLDEQSIFINHFGEATIRGGLICTHILGMNVKFMAYQCFWYQYWLQYFMRSDAFGAVIRRDGAVEDWRISSRRIKCKGVNFTPYCEFTVVKGQIRVPYWHWIMSDYDFSQLLALSVVFNTRADDIIY
jgi:hypothetical protein